MTLPSLAEVSCIPISHASSILPTLSTYSWDKDVNYFAKYTLPVTKTKEKTVKCNENIFTRSFTVTG